MRKLLAAALVLALAGCATQQEIAARSDWDVCQGVMGGFQKAEMERARRGLDCRPYYGAIATQNQAENAATANFLQAITPQQRPTTTCRSIHIGNGNYRTTCQ